MDYIDPATVDDYLDIGLDPDDRSLLRVNISEELFIDEADRSDFEDWLSQHLNEPNNLGHIDLIRENIRLKVIQLMQSGKIRRKPNPPLPRNLQP
jgi:hypothetical protein